MPLSVSIFIFTATIFLNKQRTIKINRERLAEQLLLSCKIFDHGSWATTSLNQLQLFSVNLPPNETIGENASQKLTETITGFYHLVYKEIDHIAQLATEAQIKSHQGAEISRQLLFLSENLNKIKVALAMQKGVGAEIWNNVYRLTDQIRLNIREINFSAISFFSCDVFEILRNVTTNFQEQGNNFIVLNQSILMETEMRICIKPGELAPIIENLVDNAIRATRDVSKPKIKIQYRQTDQYLFLEITDNGIGIPPKIQETIFEENFSTKKEHSSGFGLFFSRLTLEKYRGSIEVIKSSKNKGTTFLVKLKRI